MDNYGEFALVYDSVMEEIPYRDWASGISALLRERGFGGGLVLDLGCGTGTLTRLLRDEGFDMIGVDASPDMLDCAERAEYLSGDISEAEDENAEDEKTEDEKTESSNAEDIKTENKNSILYLNQEMTEFELYGTVAAIVSTCDTINYLTEKEDLLTVFRLAENYLDYSGLFMFDVKTSYTYREIFGNNIYAYHEEDGDVYWENEFDEEEGLNYYDVTIFKKTEDGLFEKFEESHVQRYISSEEIRETAEKAGLIFEGEYSDYQLNGISGKDERRVFVLRKKDPRA